MSRNFAVVAHFDPNDRLEKNFRLLLNCVEQVFDSVILVTTSNLPASEVAEFTKLVTIRRPNVGYDFYSFRVGLNYLWPVADTENILLINSSFVVVDSTAFIRTLKALLETARDQDVVGITESRQISWHLQSYLLLIRQNALRSRWLREFFDTVQPLNTKFEIILKYEIGLSRTILANNAKALALFNPTRLQRIKAQMRWMHAVGNTHGLRSWFSGKPFRHRNEVNWTHFGAELLARQFGIVKTELLRTNPHGISTHFIKELANEDVRSGIQALIDNSRANYKITADGLSTLASNHDASCIKEMVSYGNPRAKNVRVAVVLHLFYFDLLDEICRYLNGIIEPYDLYVTTPFEGDIPKIINRMSDSAQSITVVFTENRGRDIAPFISLFRTGLLDQYGAVLKLHSKKSKYSALGDTWRAQLFGKVVGDSLMIRRTLKLFQNGDAGIIGPHDFYLTNGNFWGANYDTVKRLLVATGQFPDSHEPKLGFFAGSMFWFAPDALKFLKEIPDNDLIFEPECGKQDGTLAHAIERIFCTIARAAGYKVTSIPLEGMEIEEIDTEDNRVPVL